MMKFKLSAVFLAVIMALSLCGSVMVFAEDGCVQKKIDNNAIRLEMTGAAYTDFEAGGTKTFTFTVPTTGTYGMWFDNANYTASKLTAVVQNGDETVFNQSYTSETKEPVYSTRGHERFGDENNLNMKLTAGVSYTLSLTSESAFSGMNYIDFRCLELPVLSDLGAKTAIHPADFYTGSTLLNVHNHQQYQTGSGFVSGTSLVGDYTKAEDALRTPLFTENSLASKYFGIVLNGGRTAVYHLVAPQAGWYSLSFKANAYPSGRPIDIRLYVGGARAALLHYSGNGDADVQSPAFWLDAGENEIKLHAITSDLYVKNLIITSLGSVYSDTSTAIAPVGETNVELINAHSVSAVSNFAGGFKAQAGHYSEQDITIAETGYYNIYTYMKAHQASFNVLIGKVGQDGAVADYENVTSSFYTDRSSANLNSTGRGWSSDGFLRLLMYNAHLFEAGKTYRIRIEFIDVDPSKYTIDLDKYPGYEVTTDYEAFVSAPLTVKRTDGVLSDTETTYLSGWDIIPESNWGYVTWSPAEQAYQGYNSTTQPVYDSVLFAGETGRLRNVLFNKGGNNTYKFRLLAKTAGRYNINAFVNSGTTNSAIYTYQIDGEAAQEKSITDDGNVMNNPFYVDSVYLTEGEHTITVTPVSNTGGTWRFYGFGVDYVNETFVALNEANSQCTYNVALSETDGTVIVALYSGSELVGIDTQTVTSAQNKVSGTVAYSGEKPEYAKIFVWSDLKNVTPLLKPVTIDSGSWH